jgi:hypothetical protein
MKKLLILCLAAVSVAANADSILWYGGDLNPNAANANGFASERNASVADAQSYDNFTLTSAAQLTQVFGNFQDEFNGGCTTAFYDIRTGITEGNGGTSVASGTISVTGTDQGMSIFGREVYRYQGNITPLNLAAGTYFLAMSPINAGEGRDFISTTDGTNSINNVGHPNGNQYLNSSTFGVDYTNWQNLVGPGDWDLSYGVYGDAVPEPASMAVLGVGALMLLRRRNKKA